MKNLRFMIWVILVSLTVSPALAIQVSNECPVIVQQALTATDQFCDATGRNQACYGHARLQAQPQSGAPTLTFDKAGDMVDVTAIQSLHLSPLEISTGNWGVALMRLQANLPASKPNDITLLTFGDVTIQNAVKNPTRLDVTAINQYLNVRLLPTLRAGVVASLAPGQTATAVERLADNSWVRIEVPDSDIMGWVNASLVTSDSDISTLNVAQPQQPYYRPMQAFYFESQNQETTCPEMPTSGLLIQTPEGVGEVRLLINEVNIQMGSTVYFEAQANRSMKVTTLEGHARVEALGVAHTAVAGTSIEVQLGADMKPVSPPSLPVSYDETALHNLPVKNLQRPIEIHAGLTEPELAKVRQVEQNPCQCDVNTAPTATPGQPNNCPGNSCENNPNRNGDNCPGNSCNAPGHNKDDGNNNGNNKDKDKDKDKDKNKK